MSRVAEEGRYQTARVAEGLCQAATDAGVELPKGYAEVVSEEGLRALRPARGDQARHRRGPAHGARYAEGTAETARLRRQHRPVVPGRLQVRARGRRPARARGRGALMPTQSQVLGPLQEHLTFVAWLDAVTGGLGHPPTAHTSRRRMAGMIGASTAGEWRRLARIAADRPGTSAAAAEL